MLDILFQDVPFVFIDKYEIESYSCIKGKANFSDSKFLFQDRVDICDLVESLAQLSGVHIAKRFNVKSGGYITKISYVNKLHQYNYNKENIFHLYCSNVSNIDNYYTYKCYAKIGDIKILETEISIIIVNEFDFTDKEKQNIDIKDFKLKYNDFNDIYNINKVSSELILFSFKDSADFFKGHFYNNPIVPAIYMIKTGIIFLSKYIFKDKSNNMVVPLSINNVRVYNKIVPNEDLVLTIKELSEKKFQLQLLKKCLQEKKVIFQLKY